MESAEKNGGDQGQEAGLWHGDVRARILNKDCPEARDKTGTISTLPRMPPGISSAIMKLPSTCRPLFLAGIVLSASCWISGTVLSQQPAPPPAQPAGGAKSDAETPLRPSSNAAVIKLLGEAQDLQSRHRYFDALSKLEEAEKLEPRDPNIFNTRGAIYLVPGMRDFDKARSEFERAHAIDPSALAPRFNLAELLFVKHEFAESEAAFAKVLQEFPKLQMPVRHLVTYKLLITQVKQDKIAEAEATLKKAFTFMDDTPAYYFAKASIAFQQKNSELAREWIEKAAVLFKGEANAPYLDALMEVRWVPNIMLPPADQAK